LLLLLLLLLLTVGLSVPDKSLG